MMRPAQDGKPPCGHTSSGEHVLDDERVLQPPLQHPDVRRRRSLPHASSDCSSPWRRRRPEKAGLMLSRGARPLSGCRPVLRGNRNDRHRRRPGESRPRRQQVRRQGVARRRRPRGSSNQCRRGRGRTYGLDSSRRPRSIPRLRLPKKPSSACSTCKPRTSRTSPRADRVCPLDRSHHPAQSAGDGTR